MIKIRILAKYSPVSNPAQFPDAEIFIENNENIRGAVEEIRIVSGSLIKNFIKDWDAFIPRIQFLKTNSPKDPSLDEEIQNKLAKKSISLNSLLFQNREIFYQMEEKNSSNRILFVTDPEFASLPLEILPLNGTFIYKDVYITRQIQSERHARNRRKARGMLLISSTGKSYDVLLESVKEESSQIKEVLTRKFLKNKSMIHLYGRNLTLTRFLEELPTVSYLHYAGHSERSGIEFSGEDVLVDREIEKLGLGNLEIVFFNSCFSGFHSREVAGMAAAFLQSGAIHFVGYSQQVSTDVAKFIGVRFWEKIQKGISVDKSVFELRKEIAEKFGEGETAAFTLCHFGPEFRKDKRFVSRKLLISALFLFMTLITGSYLLRKDFNTEDVTNVAYGNTIKNDRSDVVEKIQIPLDENSKNHPGLLKELSGNISRKKIKRNRKYRNSEKDILEEVKIEHPAEIPKSIDETKKILKKENPPSISKPYIPKNLEEMISEIKSPQLKNAVKKFLNEEHALIGFEVRKRIVQDILQLDENEDFKYYQFKNKTGFSN